MNAPRLILGTCAVGGLLVAVALRMQRVNPAPAAVVPATVDVSSATQAGAGETEIRNRELEKAIAAQRERTSELQEEVSRLAATPSDFRPMAIGARRKLAVFAQQNQLPPNVLDRFSILVADKTVSMPGVLVPPEADASFHPAAVEILGQATYEAYLSYLPKLNMADAIGRYFQPALGSNRLTPEQAESLADALVSQAPDPGFKVVKSGTVQIERSAMAEGAGPTMVPSLPALLNRLSAGALEKSSSILSPPQVAHFKQLVELNRIAVEIAESEAAKK